MPKQLKIIILKSNLHIKIELLFYVLITNFVAVDSTGSNLIDLHSELPPSRRRWEHEYVNNDINTEARGVEAQPPKDVFDMRKLITLFSF